MTLHSRYGEVELLVKNRIPVLLTGEKGSGKTTLVHQIAEALDLRFFSMSMTRQTTLSHLLGFMSVNGTYVPSLLKDAFENGGLYLLDELDAADANVLLCLNTIENGYLSFPTGVIQVHPDFRLAATANPQDQHDFYTGRSKLDAATLDRFDLVEIDRDDHLEKSLVDPDTFRRMSLLRGILADTNSSICLSMRDSIRYQQRKELNLLDGFVYRLVQKSDLVFQKYADDLESMPKHTDQSECNTFEELVDLVSIQCSAPYHKQKQRASSYADGDQPVPDPQPTAENTPPDNSENDNE